MSNLFSHSSKVLRCCTWHPHHSGGRELQFGLEANDQHASKFSTKRRGLLALLALVFAVGAYAQERDTGRTAVLLEEVVITGVKKKVGQEVQRVPSAISAFSGAQIEAANIDTITDIGILSPNVRLDAVGSVPGVSNFSIRGMGVSSSSPSVDPTVSVVVDGVPLSTSYGAQLDAFDLESVEVFRGPQGTLFGKNVTGGAVLLRSRRPEPSGDFAVRSKIGIGTANRRDVSLSVESPIVQNKLAGKITFLSKTRDGYFDNVNYPGINPLDGQPFTNADNVSGDDIADRDSQFVRATAVFEPTDTLSFTFITEFNRIDTGGTPTRAFEIHDLSGVGATLDETNPNRRNILGDGRLAHNFEGEANTDADQYTLETNWDIGPGTVTNIIAYRTVEADSINDLDGGPFDTFFFNISTEQEQFTNELRYAANIYDGKVDYTAGLFYQDTDVDHREIVLFGPFVTSRGGIQDQNAFAAFFHGDFYLTDEVYFTGGVRYTEEEKDVGLYLNNDGCGPVTASDRASNLTCNVVLTVPTDYSYVGATAGINWQASDDFLVYAKWTRSFRSGGLDVRTTAAIDAVPFDEEEVNAYEAGFKSAFLDDRLRINATAFINEFTDLQRTSFDPNNTTNQLTLNAAEATIQGVELDGSYSPFPSLVFTGAVGFLDAGYDEFNGVDVDGDGIPDPELARDLELVRAPELTYSFSANYEIDLASGHWLSLRSSFSYSDDVTVTELLDDTFADGSAFRVSSYELLDASITWNHKSGNYAVKFFGKNLLDEDYGHSGFNSPGNLAYVQLEAPRIWGLELSAKFGGSQ